MVFPRLGVAAREVDPGAVPSRTEIGVHKSLPARAVDMNRRSVVAGLAGVAGLGGCLRVLGQGCAREDFDVGMTPSAFEPQEVTVDVGTEVVWLNNSDRGHTVTAYEESLPEGADFFASGDYDAEDAAREAWLDGGGKIDSCETFAHTFEVPGEYPYFCIPHERAGMVGTVVVEE